MFSGIVEATSSVLEVTPGVGVVRLRLKRPADFADLKIGDSVCTDGICLTIEELSSDSLMFSLAAETLQITGWKPEILKSKVVNLERSLRWGDRVHGHLVTGHVEAMGQIVVRELQGESLWLWISFPNSLSAMIWRKGSVAINGVSLTVNDVQNQKFQVCVIPETQRRTNLAQLEVGDSVTLEPDQMARALLRQSQLGESPCS